MAVVVLLCGLVAAMVLGKVSPVGTPLAAQFGLSPAELGVLTSAVTAVAALGAGTVGRWAAARLRGVLRGGMLILAIGGLASAAAPDPQTLLALRVVEGFGYVAVVVAGPALLATIADASGRRRALALWGACIPAGLAAASAVGGALSWRTWFAALAIVALSAAALTPGLPTGPATASTKAAASAAKTPPTGGKTVPTGGKEGLTAGMWLLAAGFMLISGAGVGLVTLLPQLLPTRAGLDASGASVATAVIAAASIAGSAVAAGALQRGVPARMLPAIAVAMAPLAFIIHSGQGAVPAAFTYMLINGLAVSGYFALLPAVAGDPRQIAVANGILTQLGSLGTLLLVPLLSASAGHLAWVVSTIVLAGTACAIAVRPIRVQTRLPR